MTSAAGPRGRLILVLGGARSGKSTYAERRARELWEASRGGAGQSVAGNAGPGGDGLTVTYVATATAGDSEMADRIARHRQARPAGWATVEEPIHVGRVLRRLAPKGGIIIVDCLTLLISNLLCRPGGPAAGTPAGEGADTAVRDLAGALVSARESGCHIFVVSNEVGLGLVPAYPLGRLYRDTLGRANQALAAVADEVYLMVAGVPLEVKNEAVTASAGAADPREDVDNETV